jgi:uncharacterized protein (DUF952 family)
MENQYLLHICQKKDWVEAQSAGEYQAASLDSAGFIHCSRPDQVLEVANRFYQGLTDLILLWIDPARLTAEVRWEPADGQLFPHLYGPLNLKSIITMTNLIPDGDGVFRKYPMND